MKAALWVSWAVAILEVASTTLPVIGYLITLPLAVIVYAVQGVLVGRFIRQDERFAGSGPAVFARQGAVSALWTSLGVSTILIVLTEAAMTPVTLGASLAGLPAVLASSLGDLLVNLLVTGLFTWASFRFGNRVAAGLTFTLAVAMILAFACLGVTASGLILVIARSIGLFK